MNSASLALCAPLSDAAGWDARLTAFAEVPLYASAAWAAYKARQGWRVTGISTAAAAALVQSRPLSPFGPRLTLIQGGPVLADGADASALTGLFAAACRGCFGVDVVFPMQAHSPTLEAALQANGFRPLPLGGDSTVLLDLGLSQDDLRAALSKNWRHNLSRAEKKGLVVEWIPPEAAARREAACRMAEMYGALTLRKGFAAALDATALVEAVGEDERLQWLEVRRDDELLASRMAWVGGCTALDLLAASSDGARNTYANYLALWSLIDRSRQCGATRFDCGGIDPTGNEGVYNFKKGLSGDEAPLGRLWLRARPGLLAPLVAKRLARRMGAGSAA